MTGPTAPLASSTLLYSLAEHVQFRKEGWHGEAIRRATICLLDESTSGLTHAHLIGKVSKVLGIKVERHAIANAIESLEEEGLINSSSSQLYLSENERQRLSKEKDAARAVDLYCQDKLERLSRTYALYPDVTWRSFVKDLIVPITSELGTRTFELLRGHAPVNGTLAARNFLKAFEEDGREDAAQGLVNGYLDPNDAKVRSHLLGYLTNYTLVAAGGLSDQQIKDLIGTYGSDREIKIDAAIDTNVAFSILNLHHNPLNAATSGLLDLKKHLPTSVKLQFYILSSTVKEARGALKHELAEARSMRIPTGMEKAMVRQRYVSGLMSQFLARKVADPSITADSYFGRYISSLESLLQREGISVIDDKDISERSSVRRRAGDLHSFEKVLPSGKSIGSLVHDVTAIEFVNNERTKRICKPIDADWWFLTADFRLQDMERRNIAGSSYLPATINPAELIQLVRFWVPRSDEMEEVLLGAIKMPFSFYSYDKNLEVFAGRIAASMSTILGIEDMTEEFAIQLLQDDALAEIFTHSPPDIEADTQQVKSALDRVELQFARKNAELEARVQDLVNKIPTADVLAAKDARPVQRPRSERRNGRRKKANPKPDAGNLQKQLSKANEENAKLREDQSADIFHAQAVSKVDRNAKKVRQIKWAAVLISVLIALLCIPAYAYDLFGFGVHTLFVLAIIPILVGAFITLDEKTQRDREQKISVATRRFASLADRDG